MGESRCHQYRARAHEREVLERVHDRVLEGGVVERRDVPGPHGTNVEDHREERVRRAVRRALQALSRRVAGRRITFVSEDERTARRRAAACAGHVHHEGLLAEAVDGRISATTAQAPARNASRRIRPVPRAGLGAARAASGDVGARRGRQKDGAGVERPRWVRSHVAASRNAHWRRDAAVGPSDVPSLLSPDRRPPPAGAAARRAGGRVPLRRVSRRAAVPAGELLPALRASGPCGRAVRARGGARRGVVAGRVRRARARPRPRAEVPAQVRPPT